MSDSIKLETKAKMETETETETESKVNVLGKRSSDEKLQEPTKEDHVHNRPSPSSTADTDGSTDGGTSKPLGKDDTSRERTRRRINMLLAKIPLNSNVLNSMSFIRQSIHVLAIGLDKINNRLNDIASKIILVNIDLVPIEQEIENLFKTCRESLESIYAKIKIDKPLSQEAFEDLTVIQGDFETSAKRTCGLDEKYFEDMVGQLQIVKTKACDALILPLG